MSKSKKVKKPVIAQAAITGPTAVVKVAPVVIKTNGSTSPAIAELTGRREKLLKDAEMLYMTIEFLKQEIA